MNFPFEIESEKIGENFSKFQNKRRKKNKKENLQIDDVANMAPNGKHFLAESQRLTIERPVYFTLAVSVRISLAAARFIDVHLKTARDTRRR